MLAAFETIDIDNDGSPTPKNSNACYEYFLTQKLLSSEYTELAKCLVY